MGALDLALPLTNPVQVFALVMLVILVVPLVLARLRVPGLIGLILAGLLLGPHALGVLERGPTMQLLGTVGLLYIMFTAGLEFDLNEFDKHRHRSLLFGSITFALPQLVGTLLAYSLLDFGWLAAILLGSIFASHTLLAYPVLSRLGIARHEVVTTAVGATILTDTAALLVLAVVAGAAESGLSALLVVRLVGLLGVYVLVVLWGLPRLGRWFLRHISGDGITEYIFILAAVFACAMVAELIGVEAIIGAFLAGLGLNRLVPEHSTLMNRIQFVGEALFIPFFLIATGMLVDLRALVSEPSSWLVAGMMVGTVIVTKGLAAWTTRLLFHYTPDEFRVVFALTVPQAAATLAAVLIGYQVGLFGTPVLNGAILMILVTCLIGPWMADRYGRRMAAREAVKPFDPAAVPQRILIPLANPASVPHIMDVARLIRDAKQDQPLYPITIAQEGAGVLERVATGEKILAQALLHGTAAEVPVHPLTRVEINVARGLRRALTETRGSTVVMGWDDLPAAERFIFGSISDQLLHERGVTLLLCRLVQPLHLARRVLLAMPPLADHEPGFGLALRTIKTLCREAGTDLTVLAGPKQTLALQEAARHKPVVPLSLEVLDDWEALPTAVEALLKPEDVLVLLSARRGTVSWQAGLERLPHVLAQRFEATSFIVLYPAEEGRWLEPEVHPPAAPVLVPDHVVLDLAPAPLPAILRRILQPLFEGRPEAMARAVSALTVIDYTPELVPGVAFYHARLDGPEHAWCGLGLSQSGLAMPRARHPVNVVLVLLTPEDTPSEAHLRYLRSIAAWMQDEQMIERLRRAATPQEVTGVLEG